jgi:hypothetical protein
MFTVNLFDVQPYSLSFATDSQAEILTLEEFLKDLRHTLERLSDEELCLAWEHCFINDYTIKQHPTRSQFYIKAEDYDPAFNPKEKIKDGKYGKDEVIEFILTRYESNGYLACLYNNLWCSDWVLRNKGWKYSFVVQLDKDKFVRIRVPTDSVSYVARKDATIGA